MFKFKIFHRNILSHAYMHVLRCHNRGVFPFHKMPNSHLFQQEAKECSVLPSFFHSFCRIVICIRVRWVVWDAKRNMLHVYFRCTSNHLRENFSAVQSFRISMEFVEWNDSNLLYDVKCSRMNSSSRQGRFSKCFHHEIEARYPRKIVSILSLKFSCV